MRPRSFLLTVVLLALPSLALAAPLRFELEVSPRRASVNDTFYATVVVETDGVTGADRYVPPRFPGFDVIDSRSEQNSSMRVDAKAGRTLVTQEIRRYQLRAKRPGNFFIEPARLRLGGEDFETKGAYVVVTPAGAATALEDGAAGSTAPDPTAPGGVGVPGFSPPDPYGAEPIFIHAVSDHTSAWEGEQVVVSWLLYSRREVLKFEPKPPAVDDMWVEELYQPDGFLKYHDAMVGRAPYSVAIVAKKAVFPAKSGTLRIGPYRASVVTLGSEQGRGEAIRSRSLAVRIKSLPKGAPEGFLPSYVGRFEIEARVDRDELDAGESFTLDLVVRGQGAIRRLDPPVLTLEGYSIRPPQTLEERAFADGNQVSGERIFRYLVTPERGGPQTFPSIVVPYFDPGAAEYALARSKPVPMLVRGDPSQARVTTEVDRGENVINKDIRLIRTGDGASTRVLALMYRQWWFWGLLAVPPLAFVLVVSGDRLRQRLRKETPRARLRRARGNARKRFRLAEIHLRGNRPSKFFGELARVVYEHLEERLRRPLQSMTREELSATLLAVGFSKSTVERIARELDACDFARFSPTGSSREEMEKAMGRIREVLRDIEKTRLAGDEVEEAA